MVLMKNAERSAKQLIAPKHEARRTKVYSLLHNKRKAPTHERRGLSCEYLTTNC